MFETSLRGAPDPRLGVFETMLVHDGRAIEIERHLERMAGSLERLYGAVLPPAVPDELAVAAAGMAWGRVRLTAVPGDVSLLTRVEATAIDAAIVFPPQGVELRSRWVAGGLGGDKLVDRPLGNRPSAGPGPLVVDRGEALEAAWANLFAVREGVVRTPAADGRILAGVTRAAVIALAGEAGMEVIEGPLAATELPAADEVFLTNSIRGVEPAIALDGAPLPGASRVSRRLAAALRERWRLPAPADAPAAPAAELIPGPPAR